jgi:hypothetical protein
MIVEDDRIKASVGLVKEPGPEACLRSLLSVLRGSYPRG